MALDRKLAEDEQKLVAPAVEVTGVDVKDGGDVVPDVADGDSLGVKLKQGHGFVVKHGCTKINWRRGSSRRRRDSSQRLGRDGGVGAARSMAARARAALARWAASSRSLAAAAACCSASRARARAASRVALWSRSRRCAVAAAAVARSWTISLVMEASSVPLGVGGEEAMAAQHSRGRRAWGCGHAAEGLRAKVKLRACAAEGLHGEGPARCGEERSTARAGAHEEKGGAAGSRRTQGRCSGNGRLNLI